MKLDLFEAVSCNAHVAHVRCAHSRVSAYIAGARCAVRASTGAACASQWSLSTIQEHVLLCVLSILHINHARCVRASYNYSRTVCVWAQAQVTTATTLCAQLKGGHAILHCERATQVAGAAQSQQGCTFDLHSEPSLFDLACRRWPFAASEV